MASIPNRFFIDAGDQLPSIEITGTFSDGSRLPMTGSEPVTFQMWRPGISPHAYKVNAAAECSNAADIQTDPTTIPKLRYDWAPTDVDTAGIWWARFVVDFSGKTMSVPSVGYLIVQVDPNGS